MNWYLDYDKFASNPRDRFYLTVPTYEQRMTMIQGIEIWLSDPAGPQNLIEELRDELAEMMRNGLA